MERADSHDSFRAVRIWDLLSVTENVSAAFRDTWSHTPLRSIPQPRFHGVLLLYANPKAFAPRVQRGRVQLQSRDGYFFLPNGVLIRKFVFHISDARSKPEAGAQESKVQEGEQYEKR